MQDKTIMIEIREALFYKLIDLMKNRSQSIHNELKAIKPIDRALIDGADDTLIKARTIKTDRVKELIWLH